MYGKCMKLTGLGSLWGILNNWVLSSACPDVVAVNEPTGQTNDIEYAFLAVANASFSVPWVPEDQD
jgi:hypothetical protein